MNRVVLTYTGGGTDVFESEHPMTLDFQHLASRIVVRAGPEQWVVLWDYLKSVASEGNVSLL